MYESNEYASSRRLKREYKYIDQQNWMASVVQYPESAIAYDKRNDAAGRMHLTSATSGFPLAGCLSCYFEFISPIHRMCFIAQWHDQYAHLGQHFGRTIPTQSVHGLEWVKCLDFIIINICVSCVRGCVRRRSTRN